MIFGSINIIIFFTNQCINSWNWTNVCLFYILMINRWIFISICFYQEMFWPALTSVFLTFYQKLVRLYVKFICIIYLVNFNTQGKIWIIITITFNYLFFVCIYIFFWGGGFLCIPHLFFLFFSIIVFLWLSVRVFIGNVFV